VVSCILIGYIAFVILPGREIPVEGLILHTLSKKGG
jgi:hypothetical protein